MQRRMGLAKPDPETAKPKKFALLVIDAQFSERYPDFPSYRPKIQALCELIKFAKEWQMPVFLVECDPIAYGAMAPTYPEIAEAIDRNHLIANGRFFLKRTTSAVRDTGLEPALRRLNVDSVIVSGCYREICVKRSAEHLIDRGFSVFTAEETMFGTRVYLGEERDYFFERKTVYHETVADLIAKIRNPAK